MEETTSTVTNSDAGAETQSQTAEAGGNQEVTTTGTDTQTQTAEAAGNEGADTTSQENPNGTEENKDRGAHQTTLEERAAQIAEKRTAEALEKWKQEQAEIQRLTEERIKAEEKPFVDLSPEQEATLNQNYSQAFERKLQLEEEYRLSDDPQAKAHLLGEIRRATKWIDEVEKWYADNLSKKTQWEKTQAEKNQLEQLNTEKGNRLKATAETFREIKQIPQEVWDHGAIQFSKALDSDKMLGLKFQDAYRTGGDTGAIEFAHNWCVDNLGKRESDARQQKEAGKEKTIGGGGESSDAFADVHSFADLLKLPSAKINAFAKNNPKRFDELKKRHFK